MQTGERWRDQLYEHLQLCAAVIVNCSEAYAASQWCLEEAEDPTPALAAVLRQAYRAIELPPPDEDATTAEAFLALLAELPGWLGTHAGAIRNLWPSERRPAAQGRWQGGQTTGPALPLANCEPSPGGSLHR